MWCQTTLSIRATCSCCFTGAAHYLDVADPSRIHLRAPAGPDLRAPAGVTRITAKSPSFIEVQPRSRTTLAVQATPHAPVTFLAYDRGAFTNGMSTITVQANQQGLAQADYTITTGTTLDCMIKVTSPLTSGQIDFLLTVADDS